MKKNIFENSFIYTFFYVIYSEIQKKILKNKFQGDFQENFQEDIVNKIEEENLKTIEYGEEEIDFIHEVLINSGNLNKESNTTSIDSLLYEVMWEKYNMYNLIRSSISESEIEFLFESLENIKTLLLLYSRKNLLLSDESLYNPEYKFLKDNYLDFMDIFELFGKNKKELEKVFLENIETSKIDKLKFYIFYNSSFVNEKYSVSEQINFVKLILLVTTDKNVPLKYLILNNTNDVKFIFDEIYNIKKHFDKVKNIYIYSNIKSLQEKNYLFVNEEKNIEKFLEEKIDIEIIDKKYINNYTRNILFILESHFTKKYFDNMIIWDNLRIEGYCFINFISLFFASNLFAYLESNESILDKYFEYIKRINLSKYTSAKTKLDRYFDSIKKMNLVKMGEYENLYLMVSKSKKAFKGLGKLGINAKEKAYTEEELNKILDGFKISDIWCKLCNMNKKTLKIDFLFK